MGIYLRKSVRVGPFRFNLSKSGIGVSGGVRGLRLGTGPRGNYVHMGRGGLYYRKTLSRRRGDSGAMPEQERQPGPRDVRAGDSCVPLQDIDSADISRLVDASSEDVVAELNGKLRRMSAWPFAAAIGLMIIGYVLYSDAPHWLAVAITGVTVVVTLSAFCWDLLRKSVVLLYDIDQTLDGAVESLHTSFKKMQQCDGIWHLAASGRVTDGKYHAGADEMVRRESIALTIANPPLVKTNVATPCIPVGSQSLYFFPDRVLVFESKGVGAVSYENLVVGVEHAKFVESGTVPRDAEVVGRTWQYVNKRGGPDKRFKDNRELPVALYEDVRFTSDTGLNERIQLSKVGVSKSFIDAIREVKMATKVRSGG